MFKAKKMLVILLIFLITFSYFAEVTEALAAGNFVSLFVGSGNESKNVVFDANLTNGAVADKTAVCDVNNDELYVKFDLEIKNGGYLKDSQIEFVSDEKLNFVVSENSENLDEPDDLEEPENIISVENLENSEEHNVQLASSNKNEFIQKIDGYKINLNKIEYDDEKVTIDVPIKYENEEYVNLKKLNGVFKAVLSGTYVDDKGNENDVLKEIELNLMWKDERNIINENEISKYIQFGENGIILQDIVRIDNSSENEKILPVKETKVSVEIPNIVGAKTNSVYVSSNLTNGTNGQNAVENDFSSNNWDYDEENHIVNISVDNKIQKVNIINDDYSTVEDERFYCGSGTDEYVVTIVYLFDEKISGMDMDVVFNVDANVELYGGDEETIKINSNKDFTYQLKGQKGNVVSASVENQTPAISKVYGYLNDGKENELCENILVNIASVDSVEEILLEDKKEYYTKVDGKEVLTNDVYYKEISVPIKNFNEILGENGKIEILDKSGNVISTINNENEDINGNYVMAFNQTINLVTLRISKPITIGNLMISNKKCVSNVSLSKNEYSNVKSISVEQEQKVKFDFIKNAMVVGKTTVKTQLKDTYTDAKLKVNKTNYSTITDNEIEMVIELNNAKETSDLYGNSEFEIEMPEYVKNVKISECKMIRGENLYIPAFENKYNKDGKISIRIDVDGKQTELNSGLLTNGANIIVKCSLSVDQYTPTIEDSIKLYTYNSEATNYASQVEYNGRKVGFDRQNVKFIAPSGVISVNKIEGYNKQNDSILSIKDGKKMGILDIYSDARRAKMEIVVMNNTENGISNMAILGRFPFSGVSDVETGDDLGANIDCKILSEIKKDNKDFNVFYSTNEKATQDLQNEENSWSGDNTGAKSYLIVPVSEDYILNSRKVIKFSYDFEIPANLPYNSLLSNDFITYYKNISTGIEEVSRPNNILLTTGDGPEMEISIFSDAENTTINEYEEFEVQINVKNTGREIANNVDVTTNILKNARYISAECNRENVDLIYENNVLKAHVDQMAINSEMAITIKLYGLYEDSTSKILIESTVNADRLGKAIEEKIDNISIAKSDLHMENIIDLEGYSENEYYNIGMKIHYLVKVKNVSSEVQKNVVANTIIPKEIETKEISMYTVTNSIVSPIENDYKLSENGILWNVSELKPNQEAVLKLMIVIKGLDEGINGEDVYITGNVSAEGTATYNSNKTLIKIGKPFLTVTQTIDRNMNKPLKVGDEFNYIYTIRNTGKIRASSVKLTDKLPDGVKAKSIYKVQDGQKFELESAAYGEISLVFDVEVNEEIKVYVNVVLTRLDGVNEKTLENYAIIDGSNVEEIITDSIILIAQEDEEPEDEEPEDEEPEEEEPEEEEPEDEEPEDEEPEDEESEDEKPKDEKPKDEKPKDEKTKNEESSDEESKGGNKINVYENLYDISGNVWLDSNKNGLRENSEKLMQNITVLLVKDNAVIKSVVTNENGKYTFSRLTNGNYIVLFKYNSEVYTTTIYQKENVDSSINSDAYTTQVEQNGKKELCGVTDTIVINDNDVFNVDMGLIESPKFSLTLDNSITKITVQTQKGIDTAKYDKTKLAKYDIQAKYLEGSVVYIEYTITVTNNGDLTGFATELIDYMPKNVMFNSSLNPDWYTDNDGNLRTKALAGKELGVGESASVTLILSRQMSENNTGLLSNTAEILSTYNVYGLDDSNSTPGNRAQNEDDISTADAIITVRTGAAIMYTSAGLVFVMIGLAGMMLYIKAPKRKGGEC